MFGSRAAGAHDASILCGRRCSAGTLVCAWVRYFMFSECVLRQQLDEKLHETGAAPIIADLIADPDGTGRRTTRHQRPILRSSRRFRPRHSKGRRTCQLHWLWLWVIQAPAVRHSKHFWFPRISAKSRVPELCRSLAADQSCGLRWSAFRPTKSSRRSRPCGGLL